MRNRLLSCVVLLLGIHFAPHAHAQNILERILANPKVQALIGKPAEITNLLGLCKNTNYQRSNAQACQDAANAEMALKLPFEMRTVMSNQKSAQSLRDLCITAQATPTANSYLCAELAKADATYGSQMELARQKAAEQAGPNASN